MNMNKQKRLFMQGAPTFVFLVAGIFGVVMLAASIVMIIKGDMAGFLYIGLISGGLATIAYAIKTGTRQCGKSLGQLMNENKDYWKTHGE